MTESAVLRSALELPGARPVGDELFAPLLESPLLIRRTRSGGGAGGRRVSAGVRVRPAAFAVLVEGSGRAPSLMSYAGAAACAHAYNAELATAARDGLGSRPEPAETSANDLVALAAALLA